MNKPVILIAMENRTLRQQVKGLLLHQGDEIIELIDAGEILQTVQNRMPDLLVLETSQRDGQDTLELAGQIRRWDRRFPIIFVATQGSEALAVAALRIGVKDYFKQPLLPDRFVAAVDRCLRERRSRDGSAHDESPHSIAGQSLIGDSPVMRKLKIFLQKAAAMDSHVLITGETGSGKELAAQYIHQQSARRSKSLVSINCAALPDSLLESELFGYERGAFTGAHASYGGKLKLAERGTVFLDEIGDMSPCAQAKILRVIENKEVYPLGGRKSTSLDIRIIAATNQDMEQLIAKNEFRKDLFYRLNIVRIHLPPLREHMEDIPLLINHYLQELNARFGQEVKGVTREALDLLLHHDWPGNVRELKNLFEAIFIDPPYGKIGRAQLPESICDQRAAELLRPTECERLLNALLATNWNKSKAAEKLHWSRMTLYRKMAKYHIQESKSAKPQDRSFKQKV